jgi:hypothetical protein
MKLLIMECSPSSCHFLLYVQIFSSAPCSQTPSIYVLPLMWETKFYTNTKQQVKLQFFMF